MKVKLLCYTRYAILLALWCKNLYKLLESTFLKNTKHFHWQTYQSVCWSSTTNNILHRSLLYAGLLFCTGPALGIPWVAFKVFEGELGALGEGPFLNVKILEFSSLSSPWRSPELNLRLRKFIPLEKFSRKLENEILDDFNGNAHTGVREEGCTEKSTSDKNEMRIILMGPLYGFHMNNLQEEINQLKT